MTKRLIAILIVFAVCVTVHAAQPMRLLGGTYRLGGASQSVRVAARCLDRNQATPEVTHSFRFSTPGITVTRIAHGTRTTLPLQQAMEKWIDVSGAGNIHEVVFTPKMPATDVEYEISITRDTAQILSDKSGELAQLVSAIESKMQIVNKVNHYVAEVQQVFGRDSDIARMYKQIEQRIEWQLKDISIDDLSAVTENILSGQILGSALSITEDSPAPADYLQLLVGKRLSEVQLGKAETLLRMSLGKTTGVYDALPYVKRSLAGYQVHHAGEYRTVDELRGVVHWLKARGVKSPILLVDGPITQQEADFLFESDIYFLRYIQTLAMKEADSSRLPKIIVAVSENQDINRIMFEGQSPRDIDTAIGWLKRLDPATTEFVDTADKLCTELRQASQEGKRPLVLFHSGAEGAMFPDGPVPIEEILKNADVLSCNTYSLDFPGIGLRTTGRVDFSLLAESLFKASKKPPSTSVARPVMERIGAEYGSGAVKKKRKRAVLCALPFTLPGCGILYVFFDADQPDIDDDNEDDDEKVVEKEKEDEGLVGLDAGNEPD